MRLTPIAKAALLIFMASARHMAPACTWQEFPNAAAYVESGRWDVVGGNTFSHLPNARDRLDFLIGR